MKKNILILMSVFFFVLLIPVNAFAGEINEYEQKFIDLLSYRYEYKGYYYIVDGQYLEKVINHLLKDDVDWVESDYKEYRDVFLNNFEYGIECGYLIQDGKIPKKNKKPKPTPTPESPQDDNDDSEDSPDEYWGDTTEDVCEVDNIGDTSEVDSSGDSSEIDYAEEVDVDVVTQESQESFSGEVSLHDSVTPTPDIMPSDIPAKEDITETVPTVTTVTSDVVTPAITNSIDTSDYKEVEVEVASGDNSYDIICFFVLVIIGLSILVCVVCYIYVAFTKKKNRK